MSRPKLLLVGRRRYQLPLDASLAHKFDAMREVLDLRVVGSAPAGAPTSDDTFRLVPPFPLRALDGALFYLALPFRVASELRAFAADAMLAQAPYEAAAAIVGRRLARRPTPVILDVHGDWRTATRLYGSRARRALNPLADAVAAWAVRRADSVRTVSDFTSTIVRQLGVEPTATFPAFMDLEPFLRDPAPLPREPRALFVGVLELYKGVDLIPETWRRVTARVPEARLRIVGDGRRRDVVTRLVDEDTRVTWEPRLTTEEIANELDASTCLFLPSRREGMGRVVVEAFCRGRPVVGTRGGGIEDLVRDGENGLLATQDDVEALADALARLLGDRALAERLGSRSRESSEEWYATPQEFASRIRALIRQE
ncbi:MAG TPA: glycosyltransferase family 4 protein [Gaiellaceae bacterium]|nr:glycosyltransferase family 4 protein [Gaiellaceae bacterium]